MSEYRTDIVDAVAISSSHEIKSRGGLIRSFSILLFSVFVVVDLMALVAGTSSYGSLTKLQKDNDARIMALGPLISNVRANDVEGGVAAGTGPEGRSLVLLQRDGQGAYETRIYLYQGKIVQEYALAGSPYTPEKATPLAESSSFAFSYDSDLLTISTDAGVAKVALRNLQGGA